MSNFISGLFIGSAVMLSINYLRMAAKNAAQQLENIFLKKQWHAIRGNYLKALYNSCLDPAIKQHIREKMMYHQEQLNRLYQ